MSDLLNIGKLSIPNISVGRENVYAISLGHTTLWMKVTVTNNADSGAGSLRNAIETADSGDEIIFNLSAGNETITLAGVTLTVSLSLTIDGDNTSGSGVNVTIDGNHVSGVIWNDAGTLTLKNINIINGGSLDQPYGGILHLTEDKLTIENCELSGNMGEYGGAIINLYSGSLEITNSVIIGNTATISYSGYGNGGALFVGSGVGSTTINNSVISGNTSTGNGGAIFIGSGAGMVSINNSAIISNSAVYGGGFESWNEEGVIVTNSTIINNQASMSGGGINVTNNSNIILNNSIIWGNIANAYGNQIAVDLGDIALNYSCYKNDENDIYNNDVFIADINSITIDPQFVNATSDFRILSTSPCADAGNDAYYAGTTDIRGFGRKLLKTDAGTVGTIDMGAYEFKQGTDP